MADRDALNYKRIHEARDNHDKNCEFPARRLLISPHDLERLDWEEGEVICKLVVTADPGRGSGSFGIECDGNAGGGSEELTEEVDAVSSNRDLVHA